MPSSSPLEAPRSDPNKVPSSIPSDAWIIIFIEGMHSALFAFLINIFLQEIRW